MKTMKVLKLHYVTIPFLFILETNDFDVLNEMVHANSAAKKKR